MQSRLLSIGLLAVCVSLLAACASTPGRTDFEAKADADRQAVQGWSQLDAGVQVSQLNALVSSPDLDALVAEALAANPSLQQTLTTLKIRQAEQRQSRGALLPSVSGGLSGAREQGADAAYTGSVTVSWELDVWRKLSDESRAAGKDVALQAALLQAAQDTLAADVMTSWLGLVAADHAIGIEQRRLVTLEKNEALILQRYRGGLGTLEDLDSARTSVASSRAALAEYREVLAQRKRALKTLLGRTAALEVAVPATYPAVVQPLAYLPEQTLQRRPDLKAAYLAIQAADLRAAVAYKELLPSINLEAALSDVAERPSAALLTDPVWSLLGQLTAPLYQGGRLRAAAEIAELETAQAYQAYRETLLTAVQEVEDALGQEQALAERQGHIESALASARNNLAQYERSYRSGLVDILDLLTVQQQTYDLEAQLDALRHDRLVNRITLGLALGLGVEA